MWWPPPNCLSLVGLNLNLLLRPLARRRYWMGPESIRYPTPPPLGPGWLIDWLTMVSRLWWPGADWWWVIDVMVAWHVTGADEEPSAQKQEKIQECWGWWRGSPHLSQWRHAESEMYRIYTFFYCCSLSYLYLSLLQSLSRLDYCSVSKAKLKDSNVTFNNEFYS